MASKDDNKLVIALSIFVLLSVGFGIAWYFSYAESGELVTKLAAATKKESELNTTVKGSLDEVRQLKELIGEPGETDEVVNKSKLEITKRSADGSSAANSLKEAVINTATLRDMNLQNSTDRQTALNTKISELNALVTNHDAAMKSMKAAMDQKETELRDKERLHGEQLAQREKQIDDTKAELTKTQDEYATYRTNKEREMEELQKENGQQRQALISLRRDKMKIEGLTFEKPDGKLTFVDSNAGRCYVDLGKRDELRIGTTFSVYAKSNSGVGRSQSDKDLKGKIEIVSLLGDKLAEARIVEENVNDPLAADDPIYSPLFWPGQKLQIAVVGLLDFDGNPGSDRAEFKRIVSGAGAEICLEVNDEGKILGKNNEELTTADINSRITSQTRFLLVGDMGDENTADTAQLEIYNKMRSHKEDMTDAAENNGVYVISLSSFLDYIGYSSKSLTYSPTKRFPAVLANGAASTKTKPGIGARSSSAAISGAFSTRKARPLVSNGATSKLYRNTNGDE